MTLNLPCRSFRHCHRRDQGAFQHDKNYSYYVIDLGIAYKENVDRVIELLTV